jgi:hypothetical protein
MDGLFLYFGHVSKDNIPYIYVCVYGYNVSSKTFTNLTNLVNKY